MTKACPMPYAKKVPRWMRQATNLPGQCTGAGLFPRDIQPIYGATLPPNSGLTAFAYLWRRFGPPWSGCDDHKDLVGYILGTPHPAIWLHLHLSGAGLDYSVGYVITQAVEAAWQARQCEIQYQAGEPPAPNTEKA